MEEREEKLKRAIENENKKGEGEGGGYPDAIERSETEENRQIIGVGDGAFLDASNASLGHLVNSNHSQSILSRNGRISNSPDVHVSVTQPLLKGHPVATGSKENEYVE